MYRPATAELIRQGQAIEPAEYARAKAAAEVVARRLADAAAGADELLLHWASGLEQALQSSGLA